MALVLKVPMSRRRDEAYSKVTITVGRYGPENSEGGFSSLRCGWVH